jgi:hypothetical protein
VIIGKIQENEPVIRFSLDLHCSNCGKKVPGGITASEKYYGTYSFLLEIDDFKKKYLCGICRDKQRIGKNEK